MVNHEFNHYKHIEGIDQLGPITLPKQPSFLSKCINATRERINALFAPATDSVIPATADRVTPATEHLERLGEHIYTPTENERTAAYSEETLKARAERDARQYARTKELIANRIAHPEDTAEVAHEELTPANITAHAKPQSSSALPESTEDRATALLSHRKFHENTAFVEHTTNTEEQTQTYTSHHSVEHLQQRFAEINDHIRTQAEHTLKELFHDRPMALSVITELFASYPKNSAGAPSRYLQPILDQLEPFFDSTAEEVFERYTDRKIHDAFESSIAEDIGNPRVQKKIANACKVQKNTGELIIESDAHKMLEKHLTSDHIQNLKTRLEHIVTKTQQGILNLPSSEKRRILNNYQLEQPRRLGKLTNTLRNLFGKSPEQAAPITKERIYKQLNNCVYDTAEEHVIPYVHPSVQKQAREHIEYPLAEMRSIQFTHGETKPTETSLQQLDQYAHHMKQMAHPEEQTFIHAYASK